MISITTVTLRALPDTLPIPGLSAPGVGASLFQLDWPARPDTTTTHGMNSTPVWAVFSERPEHLVPALRSGVVHADLDTVAPGLDLLIWPLPDLDLDLTGAGGGVGGDPMAWVHAVTRMVLTRLQGWLARSETSTHLLILTRHAVAISAADRSPDLGHAAVWALIHSAQNEHPNRISVLDTDDSAASAGVLLGVATRILTGGEPQLALRRGITHIPRLTPASTLSLPPTPTWQLVTTGKGDLTNLAVLPAEPAAVLAAGQIRVAMRACGLNFHDVVVALGAISDEGLGGRRRGGGRDRRGCERLLRG